MSVEYHRLMAVAEGMRDSPEKVAILEEAIRLADQSGSLIQQFEARMALVSAATFSGSREKALVAFTWCLGSFDANKELSGDSNLEFDLMWKYKWICGDAASFSQVSLEKINELLTDFERRCQTAAKRVFHSLRVKNAIDTGNAKNLPQLWKTYRASERGYLSDCHVCEVHNDALRQERMGQLEESVLTAIPILEGDLSCSSKPESTYAHSLRPLMFLGRADEAAMYHKRGYPLIRRNTNYLCEVGEHIEYLARTNEDTKGLRAVSEHLPLQIQSNIPVEKFHFSKSVYSFLNSFRAREIESVKLLLPDSLPIYREDGEYATEDLVEHFRQESETMAAAFNQRNGNTYFDEQIELGLAFAKGASLDDVSHLYARFRPEND